MPKTLPAPLMVNLTQAAALLGITRPTLYAAIERGDLPVVCMGAARRIPLEAIYKFAGVQQPQADTTVTV